jgi:iron complex outermembrane recepter protein
MKSTQRGCTKKFQKALLSAAVFAATQTMAQEASRLETVVISGSVVERRIADAPYAIDAVGSEALRAGGAMVNLSEALARVPGLTINNRNNYAQDLQISSRGFGARSGFGVRGLRLYTDGIPASMPDGQGQVTHFDLAGAKRVEVLRGPFSVLYGNSSGGVISLFSSVPTERRFSVDLDGGSFGLKQLRLGVQAPLSESLDIKAQVSKFEISGFRPHAEAQRTLGNLRLGWRSGADSITVLASDITQVANDPLGLTRAQIDADPRQTTSVAEQFNARKTARQSQVGTRWQHAFGEQSALRESAVTVYGGSRGVTQWQAIPAATQTPPKSGGGVVDFDREYHGLDARLTFQFGRVDLVVGAAVEQQTDERRGFENFTGTGAAQVLGVNGKQRRDETNLVESRDVFAQAEAKLTDAISATGGVRTGSVRFNATDRYLSNGNDSGELKFNYTNPVVGLRWKLQPGLALHVSAGRGFESPTLNELAYRPDGSAGFNTTLLPQTSQQIEAGVRWNTGDVNLDATLFQAKTENEIGVLTNSGGRSSFQNVGRTKRQGLELGMGWQVFKSLRWQLALTALNATYSDNFLTCAGTPCTTPTLAVPSGNRIAGTVAKSVFSELAWQPWAGQPTTLAVEWRAQGRTPVNDVNSDFAGGFGEASLRASHTWLLGQNSGGQNAGTGRKLELLARVDNVSNRSHVGSVIVNDGNARFFESAAPRDALLSLRYSAGF